MVHRIKSFGSIQKSHIHTDTRAMFYILPYELFKEKHIYVPCLGLNPNWLNVVCKQFSIRQYRICFINFGEYI